MYAVIPFTNNDRFISSFPTFLLLTSFSRFLAPLGLPMPNRGGASRHPYLLPNLREKTVDIFIDTIYRIKGVPSSFPTLGSSTDFRDASCSWLPPTWPAAPCHSPLPDPPLLPEQWMPAHPRSSDLFSNYPQRRDDLILSHSCWVCGSDPDLSLNSRLVNTVAYSAFTCRYPKGSSA